jgi:hypothetical protein
VLTQLLELHPEDLRIVYRSFPLISLFDKSSLASQAAEAAAAQGFFWEMHDILFERNNEWLDLSQGDFLEWLLVVGAEINLDQQRFQDELESGKYAQTIEDAYNSGIASGLTGTPFLLINNQHFRLNPSLTNLEASLRLELLANEHYDNYPPMIIEEDVMYFVQIQLRSGEITIQLFPQETPLAVNNFIFLSKEGWFDNNPLHYVVH